MPRQRSRSCVYGWRNEIVDVELQRVGERGGHILVLENRAESLDPVFEVTRLAPDGGVESSFGEGGYQELAGGAVDAAVGPDDSVFVLEIDGDVTKLTPDGDIDPSFGSPTEREVVYPEPTLNNRPPGCFRSSTTHIEVGPDGEVVVAGSNRVHLRESGARTSLHPFVTRLTTTGAMDTTFGDQGFAAGRPGGYSVRRLVDMGIGDDGRIVLLIDFSCRYCGTEWMTATVGADGAPWTESGFEGPGAPVALGQSSTGAFVATGIPHAGEHTLVAVPFGENTSRAEFDDGSTPADVEVTEDGRIVTFGHLGNAMAVSTYDESLAMTAQFTAIPPGMTFPRVHDAVVSDDEIITAGSYVVNTDLEKRFFVARVPLSELVPTARPPAVEEDQLEDEPETEPELGMRVLKKRLPRTVGTLLNWGAIAKVTCAGHCLVTMKLLTRGRAACELGVSGVVGRGQLGLWPGETGKVGAYLTDRARRKLGAATDYATRVKTRVRFAVEPPP